MKLVWVLIALQAYQDVNANGLKDSNDTTLSGIVVQLWYRHGRDAVLVAKVFKSFNIDNNDLYFLFGLSRPQPIALVIGLFISTNK